MRTDLLSTIAHELRTPLTAVRTSVGLLLDPAVEPSPEQQRALLDAIDRNATRMQRVVGDILDLARFRAGRVQLQLRRFDADGAGSNPRSPRSRPSPRPAARRSSWTLRTMPSRCSATIAGSSRPRQPPVERREVLARRRADPCLGRADRRRRQLDRARPRSWDQAGRPRAPVRAVLRRRPRSSEATAGIGPRAAHHPPDRPGPRRPDRRPQPTRPWQRLQLVVPAAGPKEVPGE